MSREFNYDLHGILKFRIVTKSRLDLLKDINLIFSYFESESRIEDPDIILRIGRFDPSNQHCSLVDHKYWVRENYFYCRDQDGKARWEVEVTGLENGVTYVNFNGHVKGLQQVLIPDYLAQNLVLRPLIELRLFERGFLSIHGLGLEKNGNAYLFVARGGAHKTRIAMDAIGKGQCRLIGDDRLILGPGGQVFSYPILFNLFRFRSDIMKDEHIYCLSDKLRMIRYFNVQSHKGQKTEIVADKSKLRRIFFMARKKGQFELRENKSRLEEIANRIVSSSQMEMNYSENSMTISVPFMRYMLAYSFVFPESKVADYWNNLRSQFKEILIGMPIIDLYVPNNYVDETFQKISSLLNG